MIRSRTNAAALWTVTGAFAVFTAATSMFPDLLPAGLVGILNTVLLVAFALLHGLRAYGGKTMIVFIVVCLVVSNIAENVSILTGFPFGHYHYTEVLGPKLFLVPVTIGGAYFGAGDLAWCVALVLLGRTGAPLDAFARWAQPLVAAVVMSAWDFMLDPGASTINHYWIWQDGGGFFGVPFQNYAGWLLTVFVFYAIFAGYVHSSTPAGVAFTKLRVDRPFWASAIAMYALLGARYVLTYLTPTTNKPYVDAVGHQWMRYDIYETAALAAIFSVFAFSLLAALRLKETTA